jgi:hypothetical protein
MVYRFILGGVSIKQLISIKDLFKYLDFDNSQYISTAEFTAYLESYLSRLLTINGGLTQGTTSATSSTALSNTRSLSTSLVTVITDYSVCLDSTILLSQPAVQAACQDPAIQGYICKLSNKYYCPLTGQCVSDTCTSSCSWMSARNPTTYKCVPPSRSNCLAISMLYCPVYGTCVSSCTACGDTLIFSDTILGECVSSPIALTGICKYNNYPYQYCISSSDCIYGTQYCSSNTCQPIPSGSVCTSNYDCEYNYYCPTDPSEGEDPYFIRKCVSTMKESDECVVDSDCAAFTLCNQYTGICTRIFSLPVGAMSSYGKLCIYGELDDLSQCLDNYKSLAVGEPCESDAECLTELSNFYAPCTCKPYWTDSTKPGTCSPLVTDFSQYAQTYRYFVYLRYKRCDNKFTDVQCVATYSDVKSAWLSYKCEEQGLRGGSSYFVPDLVSCGISSYVNGGVGNGVSGGKGGIYIDYCQET